MGEKSACQRGLRCAIMYLLAPRLNGLKTSDGVILMLAKSLTSAGSADPLRSTRMPSSEYPHQPPRMIAFVDGQNLYFAAKEAFAYTYPNFDTLALAKRIADDHGWRFKQVRFFTGLPSVEDNPLWHHFWTRKLAIMATPQFDYEDHVSQVVIARPLRYRKRHVVLPDGKPATVRVGEEKGIDVRIALDMIQLANEKEYDVALIISQDQDLIEAADEVRRIARDLKRWIKVASAFPDSSNRRNRRGIDRTDWIRIDRATYDACLDPRDYRQGV